MIRLRCETGLRRRRADEVSISHPARFAPWMDAALVCARLQASAKIKTGRHFVPMESIVEQDWLEDAGTLYKAGILELVAWDERADGRITRMRRVDLSLAAAEALLFSQTLPRCFLPILMAEDLLSHAGFEPQRSEYLDDEFVAWVDCGGLSKPAMVLAAA